MLVSTDDLKQCIIHASDGPIGQVKDCYFDDEHWIMRYLVVETGSWLASRKVLLSPASILGCAWTEKTISVFITRERVRCSPDIDTDKPVSRQHEIQLHGHYGLSPYWPALDLQVHAVHQSISGPQAGAGSWELNDHSVEPERVRAENEVARHERYDPRLRSANATVKYQVVATDGEVGVADGLLLDDSSWAIRYLIVNIGKFWSGRRVLVAPGHIAAVRWLEQAMFLGLTRENVDATSRSNVSDAAAAGIGAGTFEVSGCQQHRKEHENIEKPAH